MFLQRKSRELLDNDELQVQNFEIRANKLFLKYFSTDPFVGKKVNILIKKNNIKTMRAIAKNCKNSKLNKK